MTTTATTIQDLEAVAKEDWYLYYESLNSIIQDYALTRDTNSLIIDFLYQAQNHLVTLSDHVKNMLFSILMQFLSPQEAVGTRLTHLFRIMWTTKFPKKYTNRIFDITHQYAEQLSQLSFEKKSTLLWELIMNLKIYPPPQLPQVQNIMNLIQETQMRDLLNDPFWSSLILYLWKHFRTHYDAHQIDREVHTYISKMLDISETPQTLLESIYFIYVQHLDSPDVLFKGTYRVVTKEMVCPFHFELAVSPQITIDIYSQNNLPPRLQQFTMENITIAYHRWQSFLKSLYVPETTHHTNNITVTIFGDRNAYNHYGPLYGFKTNTGGMAKRESEMHYAAYVFQEGEDTILNFGHELNHIFFMNWLETPVQSSFPPWFIEGLANALGETHCNQQEYQYIRQKKKKPSVKKITLLNYSHQDASYHWGSILMKYLFHQEPDVLTHLFREARNHTLTPEICNVRVTEKLTDDLFHQYIESDLAICHQEEKNRVILTLKNKLASNSTIEENLNNIDFNRVDVNTQFENNNTLLHLAVRSSNWEWIWRLLNLGASRKIKNNQGKTPRQLSKNKAQFDSYVHDYEWKKNNLDFFETLSPPTERKQIIQTPTTMTHGLLQTSTTPPSIQGYDAALAWGILFPVLFVLGLLAWFLMKRYSCFPFCKRKKRYQVTANK